MRQSIFIGFDAREVNAFAVARSSIERRVNMPMRPHGLILSSLQAAGLYTRPTLREGGELIDLLSKREDYSGAISTEFAISRFLVPHLAESGWALFMDCDMLVRSDLSELFTLADPSKAVMVVKHNHQPTSTVKKGGKLQTSYPRKNWSSVMLFNCDHPANKKGLTLDLINSVPGRDLHAFCWLEDEHIGELDPAWNFLVGETEGVSNPKIVHFTNGIPSVPGYENSPYADEWRAELVRWAL